MTELSVGCRDLICQKLFSLVVNFFHTNCKANYVIKCNKNRDYIKFNS